MNHYFLMLFAVAFIAAAASFISYDGKGGNGIRGAIFLVLLLAVSEPAVDFIGNISFDKTPDFSEWQDDGDAEYEEAAEEAFSEGVKLLVVDKFGIKEENVAVKVTGFDLGKMRAEKIEITLYGTAAFADPKAIEKFITENGLGECYAKIGL